MGTWSHGNFDNDTAADHLGDLTGRLISEIEEAMSDPESLEPDEYWGNAVPVNLEILSLLAAQGWVGIELPEPEIVRGWKERFMTVWEGSIDDLAPKPDYKENRRLALHKTFDDLIARAESARAEREAL